MTQTIFIAGTDTDVGKTHVAQSIARRLVNDHKTVGVYKPVASGCRREGPTLVADDAVKLWHSAGKPLSLEDVCPQRFEAALAPPLAAAHVGQHVDQDRLIRGADAWRGFETTIIEGAGGLFSPIGSKWLNIDLLQALAADEVVLVAANRIGVAHQVLVCLTAAASRGVSIDRVILNDVCRHSDLSSETNLELLQAYVDGPLIETMAFDDSATSL